MRIPALLALCSLLLARRAVSLSLTTGTRRQFLIHTPTSVGLLIFGGVAANGVQLPTDDEIQSTLSGVQYRDDRIGQGGALSKGDLVVLHLQGVRRDGSIFLDTRRQGRPLLHKIGTSESFAFSGKKSSQRPAVTLGVEDAMRGMKLGGIRRIVVPSALGYGYDGVSRYDAMKMGLLVPIPRDELLRYELELLRCVDLPAGDNGLTRQACCTEPNYPRKTDSPDKGS